MFDFKTHLQHTKNSNLIFTFIVSVLPSKFLATLTHPWQQPKKHPKQHPSNTAPNRSSTSLAAIKITPKTAPKDPTVAPTTSLQHPKKHQGCNHSDCTNHPQIPNHHQKTQP